MVTTTSATPPSKAQVKDGQDHTGAAAVFVGSQSIGSTGVKTFNATGHTALQTYYGYVVHTDAAGNDSDVEATGAFVMFRNGATAQSIIDDTAPIMGVQQKGALYDLALTVDPDDWLSWYEVTPPSPSGGTLDPNPNGSFTYNGPDAAIWVIQPEVNMVEEAETTIIELYDQTGGTLKTWNGSAWVVKPLKYWTGTEWLTKPLKRWNGSAWV